MFMRRRRLLTLGALGFGSAVGGLSLWHLGRALAMSATPPKPGIQRLRGTVRLNGYPTQAGDPVLLGDRLTTGADSEAVVVIHRDAFLLRENSEIHFDSGDPGYLRILRLLSGKLLSVFAPRQEPSYIHTPVATIGIRGTGVYVESEGPRSYVCTCYGATELTPVGAPDQAQRLRTQHHEQPRYLYGAKTRRDTLIEPAPVINHTDAELIMLEELLGRRPPFAENDPYDYGY